MTNELTIAGSRYRFDATNAIDISIPLNFNGPQPNAYGVDPARSTPCAAGEIVGDTRQGGSCNFEQYTFIPHCNGTHTECVGHITHERISIRECLKDVLIPALLVSVEPDEALGTTETYSDSADIGDLLITRSAIETSVGSRAPVESLIIRTMPNNESKLAREYGEPIPPYFTTEAMEYLIEVGVKHLLVDLPSIDRLYDYGRLTNHRIFWAVEQGKFETGEHTRGDSTITELIFVPETVKDGSYLLNLQIAPFASDASPSRPILFPVEQN